MCDRTTDPARRPGHNREFPVKNCARRKRVAPPALEYHFAPTEHSSN
jgi:hypothetical protein